VSNILYLVNYYTGDVQSSFDNAKQLVSYLKEKDKQGTLMGESAYGIFVGRHLATAPFWEEAFGKEKP